MTIATSITEQYLIKSQPFFESAVKHFEGKRICFCIGFITEIEGWETVYVPIESLQINWQPQNRKDYYCLQHGEFINHYPFENDDLIMFCDSDMILQKQWDVNINYDPGTFYATRSSFPPTLLRNVIDNIGCSDGIKIVTRYGIELEDTEFCTCLLIASVESWKLLNIRARINKSFLTYFKHHAAWQLLINIMVQATFKLEILPPTICCADWYSGTPANYVADTLMVGGKVVYFDHTKFKK